MTILGLDIGGANIKAATTHGFASSTPFALWRHPHDLQKKLAEVIASAPPSDRFAITITGELADCFESKKEGIHHIVNAAQEAAGPRDIQVLLVGGAFVDSKTAIAQWLEASASNWWALACLAASLAPQNDAAILIDVGSTTTDIIPLSGARPIATGTTDLERMAAGELFYSGVRRSPLCAVASTLPWNGRPVSLAQEVFATTSDVYLLIRNLLEDPQRSDTADGRPFTRSCSLARLARMFCADLSMITEAELVQAAAAAKASQLSQLGRAGMQVVRAMPAKPTHVILAGEGEFLGRELAAKLCPSASLISLAERLGDATSNAAAAYAAAWLLEQGQNA